MRLVCDRGEVLAILARFRKAGAALFAPNGELPAEIEGLCMGAQAFADAHGLREVPIAIGMTGVYADGRLAGRRFAYGLATVALVIGLV